MAASPRPSPLHPARRALLCAAAIAASLVASPAVLAQTIFMRVDGVKGENPAKQPLGPDAFPLLNFTLPTDPSDSGRDCEKAEKPERFGDVSFTAPISGATVALWQLAAERKEIPKVSIVSVDPNTGAARYRVDFEQVVLKSLGLQAINKRDAAAGSLSYQRVRIRSGDGKDAPTSSWDRSRNAPWK